jgi:hypothetical protein
VTKRVNLILDDEAAELLPRLAGSSRKQGEFLSNLIRAAANQQSAVVQTDRTLADLGRQVLRLVEQTELPLGRATALASEPALARLWDTPEEDAAWQHL